MSDGTQQNGKGDKSSASLRGLPSVDKILSDPLLVAATTGLPHHIITDAARAELQSVRDAVRLGSVELPQTEVIVNRVSARAWESVGAGLKAVINATGVIIHTNLGRAPLSKAAQRAVQEASGYGNLEFNLAEGTRGSRYTHAVEALRRVTGCEDALVVNNTAAALVLVLAALAQDREVIVSRGQLVEIGGGFRIPEIMIQSGTRLVEVGTTNRTYVKDYAAGVTDDTAMIMRIHASNFRIVGFATSPSIQELSEFGHSHGLIVADDIGSGAVFNTEKYGLLAEPTIRESLGGGADLCLFSGDKLLGGPQCGVIVGKWSVIEKLKRHPLTRALRVDKMTLAALEATLLHYIKGDAEKEIPVWRMISMTEGELRQIADTLAEKLSQEGIKCDVVGGRSAIGGGSLPGETLPTWLVGIDPPLEAGEYAGRLRGANVPVIARVEDGKVMIDPRTVADEQLDLLAQTLVDCSKI